MTVGPGEFGQMVHVQQHEAGSFAHGGQRFGGVAPTARRVTGLLGSRSGCGWRSSSAIKHAGIFWCVVRIAWCVEIKEASC
jgi:hypothetical protein